MRKLWTWFLARYHFFVAGLTVGLILLIGVPGFLFQHAMKVSQTRVVEIPKGMSVLAMQNKLKNEGITCCPKLLALAQFFYPWVHPKKSWVFLPGEYEFLAGQSLWEVAGKLATAKRLYRKFRIVEGASAYQILKAINESPFLQGPPLQSLAEGVFLPDTYYVIKGEDRANFAFRLRDDMRDFLKEEWAKRDPTIPLKTPKEALILASIVEKETSLPEEYTRVAGVYLTRLKKNMRLQADPTVLYALYQGKIDYGQQLPPLVRSQLRYNSPYNTYVYRGLPPAPISFPSKKALLGVLRPVMDGHEFFVADGKGGHIFTKTWEEHQKAVAQWRSFQDRGDSD